ncbi:MAG: hypothetical protein ACJA08_000070 [Cyclobacteriaceae bacterium]|jgi:hypothetical protein
MRFKHVIFSVIFLSHGWLNAQDNAPKYSNEFMNIGVGARTFGLGLSAVSYIDDATASYWNPAGLNHLKPDHQLSLMHSAYFAGIANYDFASFATSVDSVGYLGISVLRFSVDDIADTRFLFDGSGGVNYDNIRYFSSSDYAVFLTYARVLPFLGGIDFGANAKIIRRVVGDFADSWGFGLDIGFQKNIKGWNVGLVGKDLFGTFNSWSYNTAELSEIYTQTGNEIPVNGLEVSLPRMLLGGSRVFSIGEMFTVMPTVDMAVTFDGKRNTLIKTEFASIDPYGGVELGFKKMAFLRLGVSQFQQIEDFDTSKSWSFQPNLGVGFKIQELTVDYAFTDIGDQSAGLYSHVFSVKVDFYSNEK